MKKPAFPYTLSLISGKYKMVILYCLMEFHAVCFNELHRYLKSAELTIVCKSGETSPVSSRVCPVFPSKATIHAHSGAQTPENVNAFLTRLFPRGIMVISQVCGHSHHRLPRIDGSGSSSFPRHVRRR